ncbi:MAG: 1-(5-phosphoribosyl)-5-[(5-phosphoribosylamino)methylideneamino]imidazole-4-carboxamide isomerase [Omnitrophica WOR_2 bacterium RIFCSPHIGHO2_01_FULL_48_9]|nr:MAG: 1-(5-phosphoribosyl)-5-[(5-phosphoribosylamino)methylideneamino]imidazole-4-carboxamide isomerase [Omnitrophica WOR_2 bacterium RIFCSPHIGHO2_02_FULL_48_11]OGX33916.1 MAG: 1-(5-phosphoribosyl)-5-[(5-phosphoribosylamino)methylideneamino]imidazole-4-carboxamide isomerase [Omnitrophica WOR_2 bacterium RIFCSPHIGHO2_01_FULL_48_9]
MIVIPAIDIKDGKVVRLMQGRFNDVTQYSDDPVKIAQRWEGDGAQWLHVVDLDGAQTGEPKNIDMIKQIIKAVRIPVQVGGGIRNIQTVSELVEANVARIVLGTRVIQDQRFRENILTISAEAEKIAVSLDCSNGLVAQRGWTEVSNIKAVDFAKELEQLGLKCLIYTDIARDGMLSGPNIAGLKEILDVVNMHVIASGGISGINDLQKLLDLKDKNLIGVITGKAIYEGKLDLKEAIQLCAKE